jgi:hypothetical protein
MTVANEMTAEERRKRLMHGLTSTQEEMVVVNVSHLAHAIGMDAAEKLVQNLVAMDAIIPTPYSRKPQYKSDGLCTINRLEAIEAIERVTINAAKLKIDKKLQK